MLSDYENTDKIRREVSVCGVLVESDPGSGFCSRELSVVDSKGLEYKLRGGELSEELRNLLGAVVRVTGQIEEMSGGPDLVAPTDYSVYFDRDYFDREAGLEE